MSKLLKDKKILIGVTGSIAAYKTQLLVRELVKAEAEVHVVMTPASTNFVTALTMANLSRNPVISDMFDKEQQKEGAWHIHAVHNCDLMLIAPCSAATLGKIANGICDNSLVTLAMALPRNIPLLVSPAMDATMWLHPATQRNIKTLKKDGVIIISPEEGELSSGLTGPGRMPDISVLISKVTEFL